MRCLVLLAVAALPLLSGCEYHPTYGTVAARAERIAQGGLQSVQADRAARLRQSSQEAHPRRPAQAQAAELKYDVVNLQALSLTETLKLATTYNRQFANERDANLSAALGLISARHLFDPRLSGAVAFLETWARDTGADTRARARSASGTLGLEYLSVVGTRIQTTVSTEHLFDERNQNTTNSSRAAVSLAQPLLRGAGRMVTREPLTMAERSLTYRLRAFELFRQSFTIDTVSRYYGLVRDLQVVENNKRRFDQADFLYRRAVALQKIGRVPELDVLNSEQSRLQAENDLRDAEENHKDALSRFKTFLGLPDEVRIGIDAQEIPAFQPVEIDSERAIDLAYANRLDFATASDQLEDTRRALAIARNGQLPDLSLVANAGSSAVPGAFPARDFQQHSASAGVTLQLPLDRLAENTAVKQAQLALASSERGFTQFGDDLASDVRTRLRNLLRIEQSVAVQKKIVSAAEKRVASAERLFRMGQRTSDDVVRAQSELLQARNTYINFIVDHAVADLELRRALGVLMIGADGRAQEFNYYKPQPEQKPELPPGQVPEEAAGEVQD